MTITKKQLKIINIIVITLVFVCSFFLMNKYMIGEYASDYPAHIKQSLSGNGYSLVSVIMKLLYGIFQSKVAISFFMSLIVISTPIVCFIFIKKVLALMNVEIEYSNLFLISILSLFICKICIPEWSDLFYKGSISSQSWHNSTYTMMRPFSIISLYLFFLIQKNYLTKISIKECILFTIVLFLTNFTKPNFILGFAPIMLIVLIKSFINTKTKSFKNAFIFGMCVLISCTILVFVYNKNFGVLSDQENSMAISISNMVTYFSNNKKFLIYFVLSLCYPIYITILFFKNKNSIDNYSKTIFIETWLMFILSFIESLLLVEVGPRAADGNFCWGRELFSYILFVVSICIQIKLKKENVISVEENTVGCCIFVIHIIFGLAYFALLLMGYHYYF